MSKGMTHQEMLDDNRRIIDQHGYSLMTEFPPRGGGGFTYTVGLTRLEGHPELVVTGLPMPIATETLNRIANQVVGGRRLAAGHEIRSAGLALTLLKAVQVTDPGRLEIVQEIYGSLLGPVPALQLVWANVRGVFPGQRGWCPEHDGKQEMFGKVPTQRPG